MGDARDPSVPPRGSVPPAKPLATITGPANRKPAAQTLVGYEAPSPDTLIGYEAPTEEVAEPARPSAPAAAKPAPKPVPRASVPPPVARPSAAPPRADVTAKGRSSAPSPAPKGPPPRTSAPAARPSAPPPPPRASAPSAPPPLQNDELAELDAVLGTPPRKDPSIEMLTSQELVLEPDPIKPPRIDQTEELTNLEVERLSITPPPVPAGRAVRTSADDIATLPTQGRGWVLIGIPVVLAAVAGLLYFAMREQTAAPNATATSGAPATPAPAAASASPAAAPPAATPAVTPTPSATAAAATPPPASTASAAAPTPPSPAPAPAAAPAAAAPLPAAASPTPAPVAGLFDAARLAELAPMPEVPTRTARLRASARESRAERALSNASREMRRDDYDDARAAYTSALTYMPENTDAMLGLARIAVAEEAWDKALAWTQRAMAIAPRDVDILLLRGDAQLGAGYRDAARATWQQVLEIDPRNRDARSRMRRRARRR